MWYSRMKLIFCPRCEDLFKLSTTIKFCDCGESSGRYEENENDAIIFGLAVPIGIGDISFEKAFCRHREGISNNSYGFDAYFFQKSLSAQNIKKGGL